MVRTHPKQGGAWETNFKLPRFSYKSRAQRGKSSCALFVEDGVEQHYND
jgi:hypothetical protein